jgi:hypothetical protein
MMMSKGDPDFRVASFRILILLVLRVLVVAGHVVVVGIVLGFVELLLLWLHLLLPLLLPFFMWRGGML